MRNIFVKDSLKEQVNRGLENADEHSGNPNSNHFSLDLTRLLIISHDGCFIIFWSALDTACCLVSSYIYAWIACFGDSD